MKKNYRILVINPGSTSTKIGVFNNEVCIFENIIRHHTSELTKFHHVIDQYEYRKNLILKNLDYEGISLTKMDAICARGGLVRAIEGGTYIVNEAMLEDLRSGYSGDHASNLGGIIAHEIASALNIPAYIVDPVVVDEMHNLARYSGMPDIPRKSIFHALNQKAVGRRIARDMNKAYEDLNIIIAHMGGGITVGAHHHGKVIDVNNGLHGDGPFSPERAGTVPIGDLISLCYSGQLYLDEIMDKIVGHGGLMAYLGTSDAREIEQRIHHGDQIAKEVYEAMAYQVAKEIGAMSVVCYGKVDAIILTGGLAYGTYFTSAISERIAWIADVIVYPGENELQALAEGTLRVLHEEEKAKIYLKKD